MLREFLFVRYLINFLEDFEGGSVLGTEFLASVGVSYVPCGNPNSTSGVVYRCLPSMLVSEVLVPSSHLFKTLVDVFPHLSTPLEPLIDGRYVSDGVIPGEE